LAASTEYDWRVLAHCGAGYGNYTQATFTTSVCNDVYESNNTSSQAKSISLGTLISANISSGVDVDWFKVTMPNNSNTTLHVTLSNLPADYDLYVYNKNLSLVASSITNGTSNESVTYYSNSRNATYYIKVIGKSGAYNSGQCYNLMAQATGSGGSITQAVDLSSEVPDITGEDLLYPNPASDFVYLQFRSKTEATADVQILSGVGQLIKHYPVNIVIGVNLLRITVSDLRPGIYVLRTNIDGPSLMRKFVISR
jgi:hypothetical protein